MGVADAAEVRNRTAIAVCTIADVALFIITLVCMPLLPLLRKPRRSLGEPIHVAVE